jgi:hypothetical protein
MKIRPGLLFIFSILLICSCKKESDQVLPDFPWDCDYDIGTYEILPSSYTKIAYEGKQRVVFEDSLGNEAAFIISTQERLNEKSRVSAYDIFHPQVEINYCYYGNSKEYQLNNDSLKTHLKLTLFATPDNSKPLDLLVSDQLKITFEKAAIYSLYATYGIFTTTVDQRTSTYSFASTPLDSISFFGKTYYNVEYHAPSMFFHYPVYYSTSEGIVYFNEAGGKSWRFERFE